MINIERLRTLEAIATHGSVSAAAAALHLTTSAVSQQMARLEAELGEQLLERQGRGVRLTDSAEVLVEHARKILRMVEVAKADLEARRDAVVGNLQIGAFASAVRGLGVEVVRRLQEAHPDLAVALHELEPDEAVPRVLRGDLDLAILQDWMNQPLRVPDQLERSPLMDDEADVALPASHPLADRERVSLSELVDEPWIGFTEGWVCHQWLITTMRSQGHQPVIAHSASEYASHLEFVAAGLGLSVIPRLGRKSVPEGVRMVAVDPPLQRHIYGVWRCDAARRPSIRAALDTFRSVARECTAAAATQ